MDVHRNWQDFAWYPTELETSSGGGREVEVNYRAPVGWRVGETSDSQGRPMADRSSDSKAFETVPSPSGSTKRYRGNNGSQSIPCLVDGCNSDLSNCREYHRRHRVCEQHSKTPIVVVGGKQQRFCQQCSRFHALVEFDEVKRSCRKRLDGHNRRRRKPQLSSLFMTGERFLTSYRDVELSPTKPVKLLGPRILQFSDPDIYAAINIRSTWPVLAKNESILSKMYDHQQLWNAFDQQVPPSSLTDMKRGRGSQFSLLEEYHNKFCHGNRATSGVSVHTNKTLPGSAVSPDTGQGSQRLSEGTTRSIDSGCALYLLSSNITPTSEWSLVQSSVGYHEKAQCLEQHFGAADKHLSSRGDKDKPSCPVLVLDADRNKIHYNGMRHAGLDEPVEGGDLLTLPFLWE